MNKWAYSLDKCKKQATDYNRRQKITQFLKKAYIK